MDTWHKHAKKQVSREFLTWIECRLNWLEFQLVRGTVRSTGMPIGRLLRSLVPPMAIAQ
ncbi:MULTISPECIES: hypothetical protein [Cyanophyceae]|uniref:hypothetical protein n=1 Tax=Cyanophyceae TaxID=3028117 RepID=UPI001F5593B9|nr:hypothetical protein [Trichocoleus sp. FACHB-40]